MTGVVARFIEDDGGQDLVEYALLCALLAVACITMILNLTQMREFFTRAGQALNDAL